MENTELHTEKVKILSRLIKETSLTLEEALLLLKEEEVQEVENTTPQTSTGTWTTYPYQMPTFLSGGTTTISTSGNIGMATTSPTGVLSSSSFTSSIAEDSAPDLNN